MTQHQFMVSPSIRRLIDAITQLTHPVTARRDATQPKTSSLGSSARARKAFLVGRSSIGFLFAELV